MSTVLPGPWLVPVVCMMHSVGLRIFRRGVSASARGRRALLASRQSRHARLVLWLRSVRQLRCLRSSCRARKLPKSWLKRSRTICKNLRCTRLLRVGVQLLAAKLENKFVVSSHHHARARNLPNTL